MAHRGQTAVVFTDGSCLNQGLANAKAGYGVFWADGELASQRLGRIGTSSISGHPNNRSGAVDGRQNSNRAELFAAVQAIKTAVQQGFSAINIISDSSCVRHAVNNAGNYRWASQDHSELNATCSAPPRTPTCSNRWPPWRQAFRSTSKKLKDTLEASGIRKQMLSLVLEPTVTKNWKWLSWFPC